MNCVGEIRSNPSNFNEAMLGSSLDADYRFRENPDHWGGYIKMDRLSRFCKVEICVLHIEECNMAHVNSRQATNRILLLGDDTNYHSVIFRGLGADKARRVAVNDMRARELAMQMDGDNETGGSVFLKDFVSKLIASANSCHGARTGARLRRFIYVVVLIALSLCVSGVLRECRGSTCVSIGSPAAR
jgi:hypothetical protein